MSMKRASATEGATTCVALLADVVDSRASNRTASHAAILRAIKVVNRAHPAIDPLRVTVGDELQGVYETAGQAIGASYALRLELAGEVALRFGIGGGEVTVVDAERGIQDGSGWWNARAAIEQVEELADDVNFAGIRTGIVDERQCANPLTSSTLRLVDAQLASMREGAIASLRLLLAGFDNQDAAREQGISPSANSQRVWRNSLRVVAGAITSLSELP